MKQFDDNDKKEALWPRPERMEELRQELHHRLVREDLENVLQFECVDRLMSVQADLLAFREAWIKPLLDAGVSMDVALACIAQCHFRPN